MGMTGAPRAASRVRYDLWLFQRTMHGRAPENADSHEIAPRDAVVLVPLVACIVALALYPGLILGRAEVSVQAVTAEVHPEPDVITIRGVSAER